jgi:hypothetical protein
MNVDVLLRFTNRFTNFVSLHGLNLHDYGSGRGCQIFDCCLLRSGGIASLRCRY